MSEELKLCPFCGSAETPVCIQYKDDQFAVSCEPCGFGGPDHPQEDIAIELWNTRPVEDSLRAEVERLRKALEALANPNLAWVTNPEHRSALKNVASLAREALQPKEGQG